MDLGKLKTNYTPTLPIQVCTACRSVPARATSSVTASAACCTWGPTGSEYCPNTTLHSGPIGGGPLVVSRDIIYDIVS